MKTGQLLPCIRHFRGFRLLLLVFSVLAIPCMCSHAQSIDFGTFYGASNNGQPIAAFLYPGVPAGDYSISDGKYVETPQGSFWLPSELNNFNGSGTYSVEIDFAPNGVGGSFSGSGQAVYQNEEPPYDNFTLYYQYSGTSTVDSAKVAPKYVIMSILYDPPGDASSNGFTNTQSTGSMNSLQNNLQYSNTVTFSGGVGGFSGSVDFGTSITSGDTSSFTTTYQASNGSQLNSAAQDIDHTQDQFFLWINPTITVTQDSQDDGYYVLGTLDANGNFSTNDPVNIVNVSIAQMQNPSTIPLYVLEPQTVSPGITLPGLASICANPLPVAQCTQLNACGCLPSDFSAIIQEDELAGDTTQSQALNVIDPNRYVPITYIQLEGPATGSSGTVKNTSGLTDTNQSCVSHSNAHSYTTGVTVGWTWTTGFSLGVKDTQSVTVSQTESSGNCSGQSHAATVTEGSDVSGCYMDVDVYEDTVYHTFAFALPADPTAPNAVNNCNFTHH